MLKHALGVAAILAAPLLGCESDPAPATTSDDTNEAASDSGDASESDTAASDDTSTPSDDTATGADASEDAGPSEDVVDDASDSSSDDASADVSDDASTDVSEDVTDPGDDTSTDTSEPPVTTWAEVHPIFVASCGGCHKGTEATSGSGGHAIGSADIDVAYAAALLPADIAKCSGKMIVECALIRIADGSMPATGACASNPPGATCPSTDAQALVQKWIDDGMIE